MVRADAIKLVSCGYTLNEIGVPVPVETAVEIPAEVRSVTRAEWEAAGLQGLNASFVILTPYANYSGQEIAIYRGERYGIYRSYVNGENVELYLEKKAGVTNG